MSAEETPGHGGEDELTDFVPAVYARSMEEAEAYRRLLDDHDIPAILGLAGPVDRSALITRGCPVLVPEVLLDDASRVIAERWPGGGSAGPRQAEDADGPDALGLEDPLDEEGEDDQPEDEGPPPDEPPGPTGPV